MLLCGGDDAGLRGISGRLAGASNSSTADSSIQSGSWCVCEYRGHEALLSLMNGKGKEMYVLRMTVCEESKATDNHPHNAIIDKGLFSAAEDFIPFCLFPSLEECSFNGSFALGPICTCKNHSSSHLQCTSEVATN